MITGFDNNMSDTLTTSTSRSGSRRMVSPVTFKKDRDTADVQINRSSLENGYGFSDTFTNSTGSSISMPQIDSCILGKETLEQREKFTVSKTGRSFDILLLRSALGLCLRPVSSQLYKIEVNNGRKSWIIYRRYGDFVLLNKKVIIRNS